MSTTLAILLSYIENLGPIATVGPPSPVQSLASYVATYGNGLNSSRLMVILGLPVKLADQVDARAATMPDAAIQAIAAYLNRPYAEVLWACGNRTRRDAAPGVGLRG
jgi:hypothetical protein